MGKLEITSGQAEKLAVLPHRQLSPHLENCCLRLSANVSYKQAQQDLAYLTGIRISAKTQQRLVGSDMEVVVRLKSCLAQHCSHE